MILIIAAASFLSSPLAPFRVDPRLGQATAANFDAMIVPPAPRGSTIEGTNGVLGVAAVRRLLTDTVKRPVRATTTTVGGGGG